jgi:phosphoglycolate phosphatase-like HAD superfamily hydrolase
MTLGSEEAEYLNNYLNPANKSAVVMLEPARRFITAAKKRPDIMKFLRGYCEKLGKFSRTVRFLPSLDMGVSHTFTAPFSTWPAAPVELWDDRQTLQSVLRPLATSEERPKASPGRGLLISAEQIVKRLDALRKEFRQRFPDSGTYVDVFFSILPENDNEAYFSAQRFGVAEEHADLEVLHPTGIINGVEIVRGDLMGSISDVSSRSYVVLKPPRSASKLYRRIKGIASQEIAIRCAVNDLILSARVLINGGVPASKRLILEKDPGLRRVIFSQFGESLEYFDTLGKLAFLRLFDPVPAIPRIRQEQLRPASGRKIKMAVLDWDGTVSLTCEGWHVITAPLMVSIIMGTEFSQEEWRMLAESAAREGWTREITPAVQELINKGKIDRELLGSVMYYLDDSLGTPSSEIMAWAVERAEERGRRFPDREEFLRENILFAQYEVEGLGNPASLRSLRLNMPLEAISVAGSINKIKEMYRNGIRVGLASAAPQEVLEAEVRVFGLSEYIRPENIKGDRGTPDCGKNILIRRIIEENADIISNPSEVLICGDGSVEMRVGKELGATLVGVAARHKPGVAEKLRRAGAQFVIEDFVQGARLLDTVIDGSAPVLPWSAQTEEESRRATAISVLRPSAAGERPGCLLRGCKIEQNMLN